MPSSGVDAEVVSTERVRVAQYRCDRQGASPRRSQYALVDGIKEHPGGRVLADIESTPAASESVAHGNDASSQDHPDKATKAQQQWHQVDETASNPVDWNPAKAHASCRPRALTPIPAAHIPHGVRPNHGSARNVAKRRVRQRCPETVLAGNIDGLGQRQSACFLRRHARGPPCDVPSYS